MDADNCIVMGSVIGYYHLRWTRTLQANDKTQKRKKNTSNLFTETVNISQKMDDQGITVIFSLLFLAGVFVELVVSEANF